MVLTQWKTLYGLFFFAFFEKIVVPILTSGGLMGVPIPAALTNAVDVLRQRAEKAERE